MKYIYGFIGSVYGNTDTNIGGFQVFRGFADAQTVAKLSAASEAYQRTRNDTHVADIKKFLKGGHNVYTPEVTLSYSLKSFPHDSFDAFSNKWKDENGVEFFALKDKYDNRRILRIGFPDDFSAKIFHRIDGNHRLDAVEELAHEKKTYNSYVPVSIIFLQLDVESVNSDRTEMALFHNLNAKAQILTEIEQYRGYFNLYTSEELESIGHPLAVTKNYMDFFRKTDVVQFRNISCFFEHNGADDMILHCARFLIHRCSKLGKTEDEITANDINSVLLKLDNTYFNDFVELRECLNPYSILPFVYYCYQTGINKSAKLDSYTRWFISNRLYEVDDFDAASIIGVFDKIYELRQKTIFVAMPFKDNLNFVFDIIKEVVVGLNNTYHCGIPEPIRIDKQVVGFSFDIVKEILEKIENAGLLIADLTGQNANVYYEAGYALGLLKAKNENSGRILYLISNEAKPDHPYEEAKFDTEHYKMIAYSNDGSGVAKLKSDLISELKAFYEL
jgi:hypothetical protein